MNGVEILNEIPVYFTKWSFNWIACLIVFIILFFVSFMILSSDLDIIPTLIGALIVAICSSVVAGSIAGRDTRTNEIDYYKYQVIVDDSVSINEFMDKYEILNQEGKIYTVKEK